MRAIGLAALVLIVPLALWRLVSPVSGWAGLALILPGLAIWRGVYTPLSACRRAELAVAIRPESTLGQWLTGRLGAAVSATVVTLVALPILAWLAVAGRGPVIAALVVMCLLAGMLAELARGWLGRHLTEPFARLAGQRIGSVAAAVLGLVPLIWIGWAVIPVPHEITAMGLTEAMANAANDLPVRGAWLREALGALTALDAAKLWLAAQYRGSVWVGLAFSVDAALVGFVTTRSFVAICDFTRRLPG